MGGIPYSSAIIPYWKAIEAWRLAVKRHAFKGTKRTIKSTFWERTQKNARIHKNNERLFSADKCHDELDRAWRRYNREKVKADHHRYTYLERIAERKSRENNTKASSEIKATLN